MCKPCFCDTRGNNDSLVSDGVVPALDKFGGSKADMPGYNAVLNVLRHGVEPILLHV